MRKQNPKGKTVKHMMRGRKRSVRKDVKNANSSGKQIPSNSKIFHI
jgi:hypothetical protein